eukprot:2326160-Prymnesium_polylepis.2
MGSATRATTGWRPAPRCPCWSGYLCTTATFSSWSDVLAGRRSIAWCRSQEMPSGCRSFTVRGDALRSSATHF